MTDTAAHPPGLAGVRHRKTPLRDRLPVLSHLRRSVGLQRGMLVTGLVLTGLFILVAVLAPWIAPYGFAQRAVDGQAFGTLEPPNGTNLLGTTVSGFDVLSRTLWGAQTALMAILCAIAFSIFLGVFLGLVGGYFGGWLDRILVVLADAIYSFPSLLLAIVMFNRAVSDVTSGIWWTAIPPGGAIVLAVHGITLVGESLNDLSDPRLRTRRRAPGGTVRGRATDAATTTTVPATAGKESDA